MNIHELFKKEVRKPVHVTGRLAAVALSLGNDCGIEVVEDSSGMPLMSEDEYLVAHLRVFLEDAELPEKPILMTIPEDLIAAYAAKRNLPYQAPAKDDVWDLFEQLCRQQPQTRFALRKSFAALEETTKKTREGI